MIIGMRSHENTGRLWLRERINKRSFPGCKYSAPRGTGSGPKRIVCKNETFSLSSGPELSIFSHSGSGSSSGQNVLVVPAAPDLHPWISQWFYHQQRKKCPFAPFNIQHNGFGLYTAACYNQECGDGAGAGIFCLETKLEMSKNGRLRLERGERCRYLVKPPFEAISQRFA